MDTSSRVPCDNVGVKPPWRDEEVLMEPHSEILPHLGAGGLDTRSIHSALLVADRRIRLMRLVVRLVSDAGAGVRTNTTGVADMA